MRTIAESVYRDADIGSTVALPKAGTRLENRYVFDASAREIKALAARGLVEIVSEHYAADHEGALITDMVFVKVK